MLSITTLECINISRERLPATPGRRFISEEHFSAGWLRRGYVTTYRVDGATEQPYVITCPWEPGE